MFEVMAVFGTTTLALMQCGISPWQCHRIAQCRSVKITIMNGDSVPIQVDGEAWLQKPGIIKIEHKNRVQMLAKASRSGSSQLMDDGTDLTAEEVENFSQNFSRLNQLVQNHDQSHHKQLETKIFEYEQKNEISTRSDVFQVLAAIDAFRKKATTADNVSHRIEQYC